MCSNKQVSVICRMIDVKFKGRVSAVGEIDLFPEVVDITISVKTLAGDLISVTIPACESANHIYSLVYQALPEDIRPVSQKDMSLLPLKQVVEESDDDVPVIPHSDNVYSLEDGDAFALLIDPIKPVMVLNVPDDGCVHPWIWEGVTYYVNSCGCVWLANKETEQFVWVGVIDLENQVINTHVAEPEYIDE